MSFFPVVLALVLALMAYWLAVVSSPQDEDMSGRFRHDPDVISTDFYVRSFGPRGEPKDTLTGTGSEHYPDDESTMILNPKLIHVNGSGVPATTVTADKAFLNSDQSEINLVGNVVGRRPAYGDRPSAAFYTSQIMIYADEERAETQQRVKVYQGKDWMAGTGFDMDNVTQVYNFHSNVEGRLYPKNGFAK